MCYPASPRGALGGDFPRCACRREKGSARILFFKFSSRMAVTGTGPVMSHPAHLVINEHHAQNLLCRRRQAQSFPRELLTKESRADIELHCSIFLPGARSRSTPRSASACPPSPSPPPPSSSAPRPSATARFVDRVPACLDTPTPSPIVLPLPVPPTHFGPLSRHVGLLFLLRTDPPRHHLVRH